MCYLKTAARQVQRALVALHTLYAAQHCRQRRCLVRVSTFGFSRHGSDRRRRVLATRPTCGQEDAVKGVAQRLRHLAERFATLDWRRARFAHRFARWKVQLSRDRGLSLVLRRRCMLAANMTFLGVDCGWRCAKEGKEGAQRNAKTRRCNALRTLEGNNEADGSVTIARSSRLGAQSQGLTSGRLGGWPRLPLAWAPAITRHVTLACRYLRVPSFSKRQAVLGGNKAISPQLRALHTMASQLMPLELIDRCIGSRMRVIMKGDKGEASSQAILKASGLTLWQSSAARYLDLTTSSVSEMTISNMRGTY
jgi:hypothetical protein